MNLQYMNILSLAIKNLGRKTVRTIILLVRDIHFKD